MAPKLKLIPKSEMTQADIFELERKIADSLVRMALDKKLAETENELIVRDCLPLPDLAFATNAWVNQVAHGVAWLQDFSTRLAGAQQGRVIAFYKMINRTLAPAIIASRFSLGTVGVLGVLQHEEVYVEDEVVGFFGPIFYTDGETIRVEHYANAVVGIGAEQIGFPAMVCEPLGNEIAQDPKKRVAAARWT